MKAILDQPLRKTIKKLRNKPRYVNFGCVDTEACFKSSEVKLKVYESTLLTRWKHNNRHYPVIHARLKDQKELELFDSAWEAFGFKNRSEFVLSAVRQAMMNHRRGRC